MDGPEAMPMNASTPIVVLRRQCKPSYRLVVAASLLTVLASTANLPATHAQPANEKTFATPGEAAQALYIAAKGNDQTTILAIFGKTAGDLLHSGDEVADK